MKVATREEVVSRLGDASEGLFALMADATPLAAAKPDTPELDKFFELIMKINEYLKAYGFQMVILWAPETKGCSIKLALRDTMTAQYAQ